MQLIKLDNRLNSFAGVYFTVERVLQRVKNIQTLIEQYTKSDNTNLINIAARQSEKISDDDYHAIRKSFSSLAKFIEDNAKTLRKVDDEDLSQSINSIYKISKEAYSALKEMGGIRRFQVSSLALENDLRSLKQIIGFKLPEKINECFLTGRMEIRVMTPLTHEMTAQEAAESLLHSALVANGDIDNKTIRTANRHFYLDKTKGYCIRFVADNHEVAEEFSGSLKFLTEFFIEDESSSSIEILPDYGLNLPPGREPYHLVLEVAEPIEDDRKNRDPHPAMDL